MGFYRIEFDYKGELHIHGSTVQSMVPDFCIARAILSVSIEIQIGNHYYCYKLSKWSRKRLEMDSMNVITINIL